MQKQKTPVLVIVACITGVFGVMGLLNAKGPATMIVSMICFGLAIGASSLHWFLQSRG
jgi:hypothetical protein